MDKVGAMEAFDSKKDDWGTYEERLEIYFIANDIPEEKKMAIMLSMIGGQTYQLLRELAAPARPAEMSYSEIVQTLKQHLSPDPRVIPERFRFKKSSQHKKESIPAFVLRLKKLAQHCQFGDHLDEMLRDQFICGLKSQAAQKALLTEDDDLTFACAIDIAKAYDAADQDAHMSEKMSEASVSGGNPPPWQQQQQQQQKKNPGKSGQKPPKGGKGKQAASSHAEDVASALCEDRQKSPKKTITCFRCGRHHHVKDCWYPADIICGICKKKGHTEQICKNKSK